MNEPLQVICRLAPWSPILAAEEQIMLDALLAATVISKGRQRSLQVGEELVTIEIPVDLEPEGRFHLASALSPARVTRRGVRWITRRFPWDEGRRRLRTGKKINLAAGATKHARVPRSAIKVEGNRLVGWCIGDRIEIAKLLEGVGGVGSRRGVGCGQVLGWNVEPCDPWAGFPVLRAGAPLRPLPPDWPGLINFSLRPGRLTFPYWWPEGQTLVAA